VEHWALFGHLLGAFLYVAGIVLAGIAFEAARGRDEAAEIELLLRLTRAGVVLVALGSILVLACGLWLVHLGGWGYGSGWVVAALVLFVLAAVLGAVGGQKPKQARRLARSLPREELRRLLDDPLTRALNYAAALSVLAILVLMVFKPGAG